MNAMLAKIHELEALRWAARQPCYVENCGTVCLCGPCAAKAALEYRALQPLPEDEETEEDKCSK